MASIDLPISFSWQHRRATIVLNAHQAAYNKLPSGTHLCHILGLFQVADEEDVNPYFICEMNDGRCIYADPTQVCFIDTDENGEII